MTEEEYKKSVEEKKLKKETDRTLRRILKITAVVASIYGAKRAADYIRPKLLNYRQKRIDKNLDILEEKVKDPSEESVSYSEARRIAKKRGSTLYTNPWAVAFEHRFWPDGQRIPDKSWHDFRDGKLRTSGPGYVYVKTGPKPGRLNKQILLHELGHMQGEMIPWKKRNTSMYNPLNMFRRHVDKSYFLKEELRACKNGDVDIKDVIPNAALNTYRETLLGRTQDYYMGKSHYAVGGLASLTAGINEIVKTKKEDKEDEENTDDKTN